MTSIHAAPMSTITTDDVARDPRALMVGHREEAQRILDKALKAGLPQAEALAKAGRAIRAGRRAQIMHLVELPHLTA